MKKALFKVPNGKLLKIFLEDRDGKIERIIITGDFFTYPEEHMEMLELWLIGAVLQQEVLTKKISGFFEKNKTELFGIDQASLAATILQAAQNSSL